MLLCLKKINLSFMSFCLKICPYVTLSKNKGSHKKKSPHIENSFSGAYEIRTRDLLRDRQAF